MFDCDFLLVVLMIVTTNLLKSHNPVSVAQES